MTRSSPCPMLTLINWLLKSMKRFPSGVQKWMPLARATGIGSTFDCADHSKSVCFLVRSTISCPDSDGVVVRVVIFSSVQKCLQTSAARPDEGIWAHINSLELARVFFRPAFHDNFLLGVEFD